MQYVPLFLIILFFVYLLYLSFVDIKKHQLEYWQTGLTFLLGIIYAIAHSYCFYKNALANGFVYPKLWQTLLNNFLGGFITFILMLLLALVGKQNKQAFGGADIWVLTAVGLTFGILKMPVILIGTCLSYLIFIVIFRIVKKEKEQAIAFVPFITIGTIISYIYYLL